MSSLLNEPIVIYVSENGTTGPRGETGNGIASLSILSEAGLVKTYRILFTDGDYFDFEVTDGNGIAAIAKTGTAGLVDTYTITFTNGTTTTFTVTNGEKGDKGDKGDTGNGISSIAKTGTVGLVDTYQIGFTDGTITTFNVTNGNGILSVEKTGTAGLADTYTITFTNGTTSAYVVTNGKGIIVIEKTATAGLTDTYTITYNDGTTSTFTVSNGNGIASVAKTGTAGLVDTYTITFTDGTSTTFEVTNGSDTWGQITGTLSDQTDLQDALDDKAPVITETVSGAMVTIEDGAEAPVKALTVGVEPVQDLHGYDAPWPAGGGVNLLSPTEAFTRTHNGITFTGDGEGTYTIKGTSTGTAFANIPLTTPLVFPDKNVYLHDRNNVENVNTAVVLLAENEATQFMNKAASPINAVSGAKNNYGNTAYYLRLFVNGAGVEVNMTVSPMVLDTNSIDKFYSYSNICPISGHTKTTLSVSGVNHMPYALVGSVSENGVTFESFGDGTYRLYGTATANTNLFLDVPEGMIPDNAFLHLMNNGGSSNITFAFLKDSKAIASGISSGINNRIVNLNFKIQKDFNRIRFYIVNGVTCDFRISPMIMVTNTVTPFVPYSGQTISVTFPSEAGTVYSGYVDVTNRVLTVGYACATYNGSSGESWVKPSTNKYWRVPFPSSVAKDVFIPSDLATYPLIKSNIGFIHYNILDNEQGYGCAYAYYVRANVPAYSATDENTTVAGWKAYLSENPLQIMLPLATPLTYTLTESEISDILSTLYGTNHIWADSGDVSLEYRADTKLYIDNAISASQQATRALIAGIETTTTATKNYSIGNLLIVGDVLYKVTAVITSGETITEGTNVTTTTVAEQLLLLASA